MQSEMLTLALAVILTPLITTVATLPLLFSKTYVQTVIQPTYEFDRQLGIEYAKRTLAGTATLTVYWGIIVSLGEVAGLSISNITTQIVVAIAVLPLIGFVALVSTYPQVVQSNVIQDREFIPSKRHHQIILGLVTTMKCIVLFVVFFGLIVAL